jgi:hypothetical protein
MKFPPVLYNTSIIQEETKRRPINNEEKELREN